VLDSPVVTRYELLDRIGVGGMAEIFRGKAVAAGGFEKPVAIKRILPHLSQDKRFVELLIAEAKVLSLLKHRNIVQIFDVGLGDDGKYFLVMEYVDGKDLGAIQRGLETMRRRIPFDLVLHLGAEICEALEHAHSARAPDGKPMSLVHRDVSPSNVLLSRAGEVKLTDFGIAKRAESEATGHGAVRGKFAYISPEQARNEHLDPRSDVFSVGILLWELLTNRRLFSGLGDIEALRAVREAQVPRPREVDGRLSPEIDALIMSTLSREPRNRPTAGQLGAKLRTLRYSLEVTVGDPSSELARIIESPEDLERQSIPKITPSASIEFELSEATVIRIHTADEFSMHGADGEDVARAREVIDRFEEEETRQAQLSRDQMAFLRANSLRDSGELTSAAEPPLPGVPVRASAEMTRAREPLSPEAAPTYLPDTLEPSSPFEAQSTRMVAPGGRRTPTPEPVARKRMGSQPPPVPSAPHPRLRSPTPGGLVDRTPPPGTVHDRSGRGAPLAMPSMASHPPPPALHPPPPALHPSPPLQPPPPTLQPMPSPASPAVLVPPPPMMPPLHALAPVHQLPPQPVRGPAPPLPPPPVLQHVPPVNPTWGMAPPPVEPAPSAQATYDRPAARRVAPPQTRVRKHRAPPLSPWILIGAVVMALLAFTVTRACMNSAANRPAAESR
jgi:eukaryotic-like serine/threonine-protein kinase